MPSKQTSIICLDDKIMKTPRFYNGSPKSDTHNERSIFYNNRILWILSIIIVLFIISILITNSILDTIFILLIWSGLPTILYIFSKKFLEFPYKAFLDFKLITLKEHDLFTTTKKCAHSENLRNNKIIIKLFRVSNYNKNNKKDFSIIEGMYFRLIMLWYAQENYRSKLRLTFPFLALILGVGYFYLLLWIIETNDYSGDIGKMILITISFVILLFALTKHVNNFLDSNFYFDSILENFKNISFNNLKHTHKIKLFFDKNFLVYIHDNRQNRSICLNHERSFEKFILNGKFDIKGRNLILTIFSSLFLILFIETSVEILIDSPTDEFIKSYQMKNSGEKDE